MISSILRTLTLGCLAVCALFLAGGVSRGAQPYQPVLGDPMLEPWRWRAFPEMSGLDVLCMAESKDGTIWFGTANGLWSYDGFAWVRHTSGVGRLVTTLCSHPDGTLYAGGGWGISRFRNGTWNELLKTTGERIANLSDIPVKKLALARDGSLWAATDWGALRFRDSTWTLYTHRVGAERHRSERTQPALRVELFPEPVLTRLDRPNARSEDCNFSEITSDSLGCLWFGTTQGEVICYLPDPSDGATGTWSLRETPEGSGSGAVSSILRLQDGTVWVVRAASENAAVLDGQSWKTLRLPLFLPALDLGDSGGRLFQTADGVVWLSARYMLFAFRDGRWSKYGQPELPYPSTRNVAIQTADGALWFSGPNSEIYRIDYQTSRWLTLEDLNFGWESPTGVQWFLHRNGRVVVHDGDRWTSFGAEDGLLDTPVCILGTRRGEVWVAGSHEHDAAMSRFDGKTWTRHVHDAFSFAIDWRAAFESSDGSVWFGAFVDTDGPEKHRDGILQFREGTWIHHHQPGRWIGREGVEDPATILPASGNPDHPIEKYICFGESRDGRIWAGRNVLVFHDGKKWQNFRTPEAMQRGNIETILTTKERDLWIGTRETGALRLDGTNWRQFQTQNGLAANSVRSLAQTTDGTIWAVTDRGSKRFDGSTWMDDVLPDPLTPPHEGGSLQASASGKLWINRYTLYWMRRAWSKSPPPDPAGDFRTVCHHFIGPSPHTTITAGAEVISQPGNLAVLWSGVMPWREAKEARLQFSYRLDAQPWSAFTSEQGHSFFTLPPGNHRLEVRARDADFNVDPSPAVLNFIVLPPVWRQLWFILLMVLLGALILALAIRVMLEQGHLRRARDELEIRVSQRTAELKAANRELEAANHELEAFSYSVSHDLRSPLRSIDGFSKGLLEDYSDKLDEEGRDDLRRVRAAAQRMGQLIDDMLKLSRVTRVELRAAPVNLSAMVQEIFAEFAQQEPQRKVRLSVAPDIVITGDANLLRIALGNLIGNAWKFTAKRDDAAIEFGVIDEEDRRVFFVRDNGAGFDMAFASKLFGAFNRLHSNADFPGTGVGLAIVQRVILRHGGHVWAESVVERGATFFFTLGSHLPS